MYRSTVSSSHPSACPPDCHEGRLRSRSRTKTISPSSPYKRGSSVEPSFASAQSSSSSQLDCYSLHNRANHSNVARGANANFTKPLLPTTNFYPHSNNTRLAYHADTDSNHSKSRRCRPVYTSSPHFNGFSTTYLTSNSHNGSNSRFITPERPGSGTKQLPRSVSLSKVPYSGYGASTTESKPTANCVYYPLRTLSPSKRTSTNDLASHASRLSITTSRNHNGAISPGAHPRLPLYPGEPRAQRRTNGYEENWAESRNTRRVRDESIESQRRSQASISINNRSPSPLNNGNNTSITSPYERRSSVTPRRQSNSSSSGLLGLSNLGNTCFMNSVIQCLSNTADLLQICLDISPECLNMNSSMKGSLFKAYADLMRQMWPSNSTSPSSSSSTSSNSSQLTYVSPQRFRNQIQRFAPRFMGYAQQDAQEFLRYLVQGLHEDVNRVKKQPPSEIPDYEKEDRLPDYKKAALCWQRYKRIDDSPIADLFMGQLMSTLECMSCGHLSTTFDPFWDLSLPIPRGNNVNILDCFDLFTSSEVLDGAEQPTCEGCKKRQPCRKSFSIQRFPNILVIHFKRFSGERSRSKLTNFIDYPIEHLDLNKYASKCSPKHNASYRLYGVSNHSGSVFGGHYTACCRHPKLETWFEYNDTRVRPIAKSEAVSAEAYVLFYQRIGGRSA